MAKTKAQKQEALDAASKEMKTSKVLLFTDFSKTSNEDLKSFRRAIRPVDSKFTVVKKRLMKIALKNAGMDFDTKQFGGQMGTVFAKSDISDIAGVVYKFAKANANFNLLGGIDLAKKEVLSKEVIQKIGSLPGREVLLAQVLGGITGPMRKLMVGLNELAKKKEVSA